jgi:hypothetical protein
MPLRAATSPSWLSGFAAKKARMNAGTSVDSSARREGRRSDCVGGGGERQQVQPYCQRQSCSCARLVDGI